MTFFAVVFALVLLPASEAVLPNVGSCTFMEYFCDALKCNTLFYQRLQKDPKGECSAKYHQLVDCVSKTIQICFDDQVAESQIRGIVYQNFKENALCLDGALEIPTVPPTSLSGLPCSASFSSDANACVRTFHEKFAADKSDPSLCQEQAKAKKCLKQLVDSDCTFSSLEQEVLDLGYSDYNPFCSNLRDPGATGKGQCDGMRDLNNPLNAAAGLKPSANLPDPEATGKGQGDGVRDPNNPLNAAAGLKPSAMQALLFSLVSLLLFQLLKI